MVWYGVVPPFICKHTKYFSYIRSLMYEIQYIAVILPRKLEWEPCYGVNPDTTGTPLIGDRVRVNFAGKEYIAVVSGIGITPDTDKSRIRTITAIESHLERIFPEEISFWRQVAGYYMCSVGEVYKAAYPNHKTELEEARGKAELRSKERTETAIRKIQIKISRLQARLETKKEQLSRAKKESTRETYNSQIARIDEDIEKLLKKIAEFTGGIQSTDANRTESSSTGTSIYVNDQGPQLNESQSEAYRQIKAAFGEGKPVLLHGVTGSGKTEIYIRNAMDTLSEGKNVLYLVPEIALSRQLEERLRGYFGQKLMTFHSAQSAASRRDTASLIRRAGSETGSYVVLGTRSSIFLPHNNLGLIIIDEEHDNSYKQDSPAPRYNGRDAAMMLARIHGSDVLLGSATPSLESLHNCNSGKYRLTELETRYHGCGNADIEIIDTKEEWRKNGMRGSFSMKLIGHIRSTIDKGGQVIIFRSRRSYAPALQCRDCGELLKCPHCNVSVSLHMGNRIQCHHCGWKGSFNGHCLKCNGTLAAIGAGTQKIEEEAAALFPQARIARLDSDSTQNKRYEADTIRDFSNGEIDILIGTQIISKGFDFSKLSLVVVIAADSLLAMQDFRADEKAMQLLEQLRGRSGRRGSRGLFIIQTSQPQHPVYQKIINNDSKAFNTELLCERKDFLFPPYSRIISLTVKDRYENRLIGSTSELAGLLAVINVQVTGPYAPVPDRIADQYIRCIRLSLPKDRHLTERKEAIRQIISSFEKERKYTGHIIIDVDPV